MQIGAEAISADGAVFLAVGQHAERRPAGSRRASHMDLISVYRGTSDHSVNAGADFFRGEDRLHRQQSHAAHLSAVLRILRVGDGRSHHLVAAADAEHRDSLTRKTDDPRFQSGLPQPFEVTHGIFGARQDDQIRLPEFADAADVAHAQSGMFLKRVEVREVGNPRQPNDGDVDGFMRVGPFQLRGE